MAMLSPITRVHRGLQCIFHDIHIMIKKTVGLYLMHRIIPVGDHELGQETGGILDQFIHIDQYPGI